MFFQKRDLAGVDFLSRVNAGTVSIGARIDGDAVGGGFGREIEGRDRLCQEKGVRNRTLSINFTRNTELAKTTQSVLTGLRPSTSDPAGI